MFNQSGNKVKIIAVINLIAGLLIFGIGGFVLTSKANNATISNSSIANGNTLMQIMILSVMYIVGKIMLYTGIPLTIINSFCLYALGEAESNTESILVQTAKIQEQNRHLSELIQEQNELLHKQLLEMKNNVPSSSADIETTKEPRHSLSADIENNNEQEQPLQDKKPVTNLTIPVRVYPDKKNVFLCPTCNQTQLGNRYYCAHCGQVFINGQPGIPYWCGKCGFKGPFGSSVSPCPQCGSNLKIYNVKK